MVSVKPYKKCTIPECDGNRRTNKFYCEKHQYHFKTYGDPLHQKFPFRKCSVDICQNRHYVGGYCMKHSYRFKRYGDPHKITNIQGDGDTPELRFWSRVALTANPDRCWEWQCSHNGKYGVIKVAKKQYQAHRYAFLITNGSLPADGLIIRHKCDNTLCCNPVHLEAGTHMDNARDKIERGRMKVGSQTNKSKLHERDIPEIRRRISNKDSMPKIAKDFKVAYSTIQAIKIGRTWNHVKEL